MSLELGHVQKDRIIERLPVFIPDEGGKKVGPQQLQELLGDLMPKRVPAPSRGELLRNREQEADL